MSDYPQNRALRRGLNIGARGLKGEKKVIGWKVWECKTHNISIVQDWKNLARKPKLLSCGCKILAHHIPKYVYKYEDNYIEEKEILERCLSKENKSESLN